jgi:hypothetical protein
MDEVRETLKEFYRITGISRVQKVIGAPAANFIFRQAKNLALKWAWDLFSPSLRITFRRITRKIQACGMDEADDLLQNNGAGRTSDGTSLSGRKFSWITLCGFRREKRLKSSES